MNFVEYLTKKLLVSPRVADRGAAIVGKGLEEFEVFNEDGSKDLKETLKFQRYLYSAVSYVTARRYAGWLDGWFESQGWDKIDWLTVGQVERELRKLEEAKDE